MRHKEPSSIPVLKNLQAIKQELADLPDDEGMEAAGGEAGLQVNEKEKRTCLLLLPHGAPHLLSCIS